MSTTKKFYLTFSNNEQLHFNKFEEVMSQLWQHCELKGSTFHIDDEPSLEIEVNSLNDVSAILNIYTDYPSGDVLSRCNDIIKWHPEVSWEKVFAWSGNNHEVTLDLGGRGSIDWDDARNEFGKYLVREKLKCDIPKELEGFVDYQGYAKAANNYVIIQHNEFLYNVFRKS